MNQYDFANQISRVLEASTPGSSVTLRGSLATKTADPYSDIDLRWVVPDRRFKSATTELATTLAQVGPVESLRRDPEFQRSTKRRLVFVRFRDVPLFWRVDLEIFAESIADDPDVEVGNPDARGEDWSLTASALMNALATIKAVKRNQPDVADGLLERGYVRAELPRDTSQDWLGQVVGLAVGVGRLDPLLEQLAGRITKLAQSELGS